jgi:GxxExxY protein
LVTAWPKLGRVKINDITSEINRAGMAVHSNLGPGLLENVYRTCLTHILRRNGLHVLTEHPVSISFDGIRFDVGLRLDILVEECVVVEVKAVQRILPVHSAQLLSYLRLSEKKVGLLLNFHVRQLRQGIQRIVNGLE